ncbi:MAG: HAMP domain-containing histidine kinase [Clostridia bacterium]|nr:HAMP domain-containing histidine kinase [Clostridia bacterium]
MNAMSITKKWLYSTIFVITLVLLVVAFTVSILFKGYYHNYAKDTLNSLSQSTGIANSFSSYLNADADTFALGAKQYVENFTYTNLCEVWVLDGTGNVIVSSTGFMPSETVYKDYTDALKSTTGKGEWIGELTNGEDVYALTVLLPRTDGKNNGAVRFITSLDDINRQWRNLNVLITLFCLFALTLVFISGWFFIRSIVNPVKRVNEVTRRIAAGDFSVQLKTEDRNDEIGELIASINFMTEELARTDKLKNDFISTVSHELRTPLTAIKGWTETMRDMTEFDPILMTSGLQVIADESERLYTLVEDLLDFSKMASGRMMLHLTYIDVLAELDMAVYVFKDRAERRGIHIIYESPDFTAPMMGDPDRLKQVFVNILDNAVKYSQDGAQILVNAVRNENEIIISIQDFGCGLSASDLPHVKEKFYKSNVSVKGSGIGLAVSDEIISRHGGTLDISSRLQAGTLVVIRLPLQSDAVNERKDNTNEQE